MPSFTLRSEIPPFSFFQNEPVLIIVKAGGLDDAVHNKSCPDPIKSISSASLRFLTPSPQTPTWHDVAPPQPVLITS